MRGVSLNMEAGCWCCSGATWGLTWGAHLLLFWPGFVLLDLTGLSPWRSPTAAQLRTLSAGATLSDAVDALIAGSQHDFPVLDPAGELAGVLVRRAPLRACLPADPPPLRIYRVSAVSPPCGDRAQPPQSCPPMPSAPLARSSPA